MSLQAQTISLSSRWLFKTGDDAACKEINFNDKDWDTLNVSGNKNLYLLLGEIDDVDESYLNRHLIGSVGSFPQKYETA